MHPDHIDTGRRAGALSRLGRAFSKRALTVSIALAMAGAATAATKNDVVSGSATIIGAGSIIACAGTFGFGCALQVSLLIHAGAFMICDPFPALSDPRRYDGDYFALPALPLVPVDGIIDYTPFSASTSAHIQSMFAGLAELTRQTREYGVSLNRWITARNDGVLSAQELQLDFMDATNLEIRALALGLGPQLRQVADDLETESPFLLQDFSKAQGHAMLAAWRDQNYGAGGLPDDEQSLVNSFGLSLVEQFAAFNIDDASDADLIPDDGTWNVADTLRFVAAEMDGKLIGLNAAFVGDGRLLPLGDTMEPICAQCLVPEPASPLLVGLPLLYLGLVAMGRRRQGTAVP